MNEFSPGRSAVLLYSSLSADCSPPLLAPPYSPWWEQGPYFPSQIRVWLSWTIFWILVLLVLAFVVRGDPLLGALHERWTPPSYLFPFRVSSVIFPAPFKRDGCLASSDLENAAAPSSVLSLVLVSFLSRSLYLFRALPFDVLFFTFQKVPRPVFRSLDAALRRCISPLFEEVERLESSSLITSYLPLAHPGRVSVAPAPTSPFRLPTI